MMHSGLLRAVQVYACVLDIIIASMFYHILLNDMLVMTYGFDFMTRTVLGWDSYLDSDILRY